MIEPKASPVIDKRESITLNQLEEIDKFLRVLGDMLKIKNRVLVEFTQECNSDALFSMIRNIYMLTLKENEEIGRAQKIVNNMLFKLLDFGADPNKNMCGKA